MTINLQKPDIRELKPKITVFGVGGGGGNAVNNMISGGLEGVDFVVANTDAQALAMSKAERIIQLGIDVTQGLGAGSQPDVGSAAAEECLTEIQDHLSGTHMCFVTAGMGGGTGTGAAPVVARAARELGILTVGVVTKPFQFEGGRRMKTADAGIAELQKNVDTLIVIPNQNLFRIANDKTTFADAFGMADQVLYSGVACITDLMVKEGLINLDFADVRSVMRDMGKAMMGTGESSGEGRAMQAAEAAISNPLLDETSMRGAQGLLISITGGRDMTLFEVDEAATRIREEIDAEANIIVGATFDESLDGVFRVSVVATGIDNSAESAQPVASTMMSGMTVRNTARPGQSANPTAAPAGRPSVLAAAPAASSPKAAAIAQALDVDPGSQPAARATANGGVSIAPLTRAAVEKEPDIEDDFEAALRKELTPQTGPFVPPAAEKPHGRPASATVPSVEEFPAIAQRAAAAPNAQSRSGGEPQREGSPLSLLQKLKAGFGVKEQAAPQKAEPSVSDEPAARTAQSGAAAQNAAPTAAPAPVREVGLSQKPAQPRAIDADSPYAPRRAQNPAGQLDETGRQQQRPLSEDDQLDIPAFLRRQAN